MTIEPQPARRSRKKAMPADDERTAILQAMERLLNGESNRKLTIKDLAAEAGVGRYVLTHKHTDLKDLFYSQVDESGVQQEPAYVIRLRERIAALEKLVRERGEEIDGLKSSNNQYVENLAVAVAQTRRLEADLARERARQPAPRGLRLVTPDDPG